MIKMLTLLTRHLCSLRASISPHGSGPPGGFPPHARIGQQRVLALEWANIRRIFRLTGEQ